MVQTSVVASAFPVDCGGQRNGKGKLITQEQKPFTTELQWVCKERGDGHIYLLTSHKENYAISRVKSGV